MQIIIINFILLVLQILGLYEYKVYGILDDCLFDVCFEVYLDLEYRKKWDSYVLGNYLVLIDIFKNI